MPAKKTLSKGEVTRLAIEKATVELFLKNGYHATSMRQIAEHAGLALGGIYNHFSSKEEIFEAIIVDLHPYKKILPVILQVEGETTEQVIRNAARIIFNELDSNPMYIKLMFIEMVEFNGRHGALMLKQIAPKALPFFEKLLKFRKDLRITNPAVFMRMFFGMVISYYITELMTANSILNAMIPKTFRDDYVDAFLRGVLKEPLRQPVK